MKRISYFLLVLSVCLGCNPGHIYNITRFGASVDKDNNAAAINKAIDMCNRNGGGTVVVPEGIFTTGTLLMKSNVTLYLEKGAVILASDKLSDYQSMKNAQDLSKYDSGEGSNNSNSSKDERWNRALILAVGVDHVAIEGLGAIDGRHVTDPEGEEHMRGPHTILLSGVKDFSLEGISILRASNYAFMAYELENARFANLTIDEGWDGIHIRGGEKIEISGCSFRTGDDAIAGGYWKDATIRNCDINTSCNAIRIIMPVDGLIVDSCRFHGPGVFHHRTSGEKRRCNMLAALNIQPGGWGKAYGDVDSVIIRNVVAENVATPLMITLNEGNNCGSVSVENLKATEIYGAAISIESWKGGVFDKIKFKNVSVNYIGADDRSLMNLQLCPPPADFRPLPCWGMYVKNVKNLTLENISLSYSGKEYRPALIFDNVGETVLDKVKYSPSSGR